MDLKNLSKSNSDYMLGGVCGGLGAHTPIPTWLWRASFLISVLFFGTGGLVYVILWIALPDEKPLPTNSVERKYQLTWRGGDGIDTIVLSADGKKLTGKALDGFKFTAARVE